MKNKSIQFVYLSIVTVVTVAMFMIYGVALSDVWVAVFSFVSVVGAALLMSWAAESSEVLISQGLAVAIVAILQVLPEFMVEGVIAYNGDASLITANLTGSNRLLMGVGWSFVFFISFIANHKKGGLSYVVRMRREAIVEVLALLFASGYFVVVLLKGTLSWHDTVFLGPLFLLYMYTLYLLPPEEEETADSLPAITREVTKMDPKWLRIAFITFLFVFSGLVMVFVAEPFFKGMKSVAAVLGISAFLFVQWVAPFLTELPEKISAFYWAAHPRFAHMGLLNLISSKVNQWTLLVAMVPIVFLLSPHGGGVIHLDGHQKEEIMLSMVMSVYGAVTLLKGYFNLENAVLIFGLWLLQFLMPGRFAHVTGPYFVFPYWFAHSWRGLTTAAFILLTIFEAVRHYRKYTPVEDIVFTWRLIEKRRFGDE